jgi:hypothetical protein
MLEQILPEFRDENRRLSAAKAGREELAAQFERDRATLDRQGPAMGWHEELEAAAEERTSAAVGS